ncbi:MAG: heme NO-binding domain-containing protein [SAR324 cluster bacterium]|nr:heme NO-binding domain-containing protein [SAR324 cluster bacterium]
MKGIIFTNFLEMVDEKFSMEMQERLIQACDLPSGGIYTSVGTYDHAEMIQLVSQLHQFTQIPIPELLKTFGNYLLLFFHQRYPDFFNHPSVFEFLMSVDDYIHDEVKKLYPDSELPIFEHTLRSDDELWLDYYSSRHFEDVAEGLIVGACKVFGETMDCQRFPLNHSDRGGIRFILNRKAHHG